MKRSDLVADCLHHAGNAAKLSLHADGSHKPFTSSICDGGRQIGHIDAVPERQFTHRHKVGVLFDRHRFAGQCRLLDFQAGRSDKPQVGRNRAPGLKQHEVAPHELLGRNFYGFPIPPDDGCGTGQFL
ncbi:hypothetical protein SDC9_135452 [bioreactor metagenome]|uniref:Uncharacterized protein n=1 Tax=bioreactor metagenome TaxID=1076179 RepID=A0A645DFU0_9ZZZZ